MFLDFINWTYYCKNFLRSLNIEKVDDLQIMLFYICENGHEHKIHWLFCLLVLKFGLFYKYVLMNIHAYIHINMFC